MFKRFCAMVCVVSLVLGLFIGCSQKNVAQKEGTESKPAQVREAKIVFLKAQAVTGKKDNEVLDAIRMKLEKDLNLKVEFKPVTLTDLNESVQKLNLMVASGEQLDYFTFPKVSFNNFVSQSGLVYPLDDLLKQYGGSITKVIPRDAFDRVSVNGKVMGIPDNAGTVIQEGMMIRKDWLDKLQLKIPATIEEFEAVMEAFRTKDPDGNGKNDTIPLVAQENYMNLNFAAAVSGVPPSTFTFPGVWDYKDADGSIKPTFIHPEYVNVLRLINKWYTNGWLNKDFLVTTIDQNTEMFKTGKAGIYAHSWQNVRWETEMKKADSNVKLAYIAPLKGPKGDLALGRYRTNNIIMIPGSSKNKEISMQILDWMVASKENYILCNYGIEGVTYKKVDGVTIDAPAENLRGENLLSTFFYTPEIMDYKQYRVDVPKEYVEIEKFVNSPDRKVVYGAVDHLTITLKDFKTVQAECDTIRKEWLLKLATGIMPLDRFPDFVKEWTTKGGNIYIKEKTEQYKKSLETQK